MDSQYDKYKEIIDLPRPASKKHTPMAMIDRAAQFSPFSALTGYDAAVAESARLTNERADLDEDAKALLDGKLHIIAERIEAMPKVTVTYFLPDERKTGGAYISVAGRVARIDRHLRTVIMEQGVIIPIEDIYAIEGELFSERY